jgi:hypothetical protein
MDETECKNVGLVNKHFGGRIILKDTFKCV